MTEERRRGYHIEIRSSQKAVAAGRELPAGDHTFSAGAGEEETLLIDGKVVPYLTTPEGIRIYYQPPAQNLLEAARSFVDTQREKKE
jgi:hypothetical protein